MSIPNNILAIKWGKIIESVERFILYMLKWFFEDFWRLIYVGVALFIFFMIAQLLLCLLAKYTILRVIPAIIPSIATLCVMHVVSTAGIHSPASSLLDMSGFVYGTLFAIPLIMFAGCLAGWFIASVIKLIKFIVKLYYPVHIEKTRGTTGSLNISPKY